MRDAESRAGSRLAALPESTIARVWMLFASHPMDALFIRAHQAETPKPVAADTGTQKHWIRLESWLENATPEQMALAGELAEAYIHNAPDERYANFEEEIPGV